MRIINPNFRHNNIQLPYNAIKLFCGSDLSLNLNDHSQLIRNMYYIQNTYTCLTTDIINDKLYKSFVCDYYNHIKNKKKYTKIYKFENQ